MTPVYHTSRSAMYSAPHPPHDRGNFNNGVAMPVMTVRVKREVTLPSIHTLLRDEDPEHIGSPLSEADASSSVASSRGVSPSSAGSVSPSLPALHITLQQLASTRAEHTRRQRVKKERKSEDSEVKSKPRKPETPEERLKRKQKAEKEQLQRKLLTAATAANEKSIVDLMPHGRIPKAWEGKCLKDNNAEEGLDYNKITVLTSSADMNRIARPLFQHLRNNYMHDPDIRMYMTMVSDFEHPTLEPRWTDPTPRKEKKPKKPRATRSKL
ncbi:hypothetical protein BCR34DRAFT_372928 [Clohesyomyces aquaticus]|uniref:Uncharacterized protein n=1 Tax=Clohesyomyces aquaticus TaxID=1231657 RepID=A0A1Y1ZGJ1_9PLEO|nr:hypothetical protein BCR34DRAFT_372928 [Clohesyomyces aquaticus]